MSPKHILLVDDEDDIREVAGISLEAIGGWRVSSASSGGEGIAKALAERPDAILLDVMMPGIDGPTTFARLQADPATREIPVILLTAKAEEAEVERGFAAGVDDYIVKPFSPKEMVARIEAVLTRSERRS